MDPVSRVRDYLLDNVGHMTRPGRAAFDAARQRWRIPIWCRTAGGDVCVGEAEVDREGRLVCVPDREALLARLATAEASRSAASSEPRPA
jgi:hypothetical protein